MGEHDMLIPSSSLFITKKSLLSIQQNHNKRLKILRNDLDKVIEIQRHIDKVLYEKMNQINLQFAAVDNNIKLLRTFGGKI